MMIFVSILVYTLIAGSFMALLFKRLPLISHKDTKLFIYTVLLAFMWPGIIIIIIVSYLFMKAHYYMKLDE